MVDPISSRLDSEAVAGQNSTSWFERSIPKPLCVNPRFLRVDEARGVEPLALPEVAS